MRRLDGLLEKARALVRRRLPRPDSEEIGRFVAWAFPRGQAEVLLRQLAEGASLEVVREAVAALSIPDAGKALQLSVCGAIGALVVRDGRTYAAAVEAIRKGLVGFLVAGERDWWYPDPRPAVTEAEREAAAANRIGSSEFDLAGYLLGAAHLFVPRYKPAPVPAEARQEAEGREREGIASARRAGRVTELPDSSQNPPEMSRPIGDLGEKIAAACEEADPAADEVFVVRHRRPGDPPFMPAGSKTYGSVEEWDPYERYQH